MRSDDQAGTTRAPSGKTPVVEANGARFRMNMVSVVSPGGEMRFRVVEGNVNGSVLADFIDRIGADAGERKGSDVHRSGPTPEGQVELFFLPPYSHQLNPDELAWSHVKRPIGRSAVTWKDDLKQRLMSALPSLQKMLAKIMAFSGMPSAARRPYEAVLMFGLVMGWTGPAANDLARALTLCHR